MSDLISKFPILRYFGYNHLPPNLQDSSKPFCDLAFAIAEEYMSVNDIVKLNQVDIGLQKLMEAKDCIVRAKID